MLHRTVPVAPDGNRRSASSHSSTPGAPAFLRPGVDQLRLAAGPAAQRAVGVQAVAAEVHQRAAGEVERPARVAVVRLRHRDQRVDALELAQLAGIEECEQPLHHRVEQVVETLDDGDPGVLRRGADLDGLLRGGGERLLRQNVLARRRRRPGSTVRGTRSAAGCRRPQPRGRPARRRRSPSPARRRARAANASARFRSRAATVTSRVPVAWAGFTIASSAIRAAPRMPTRSGSAVTDPATTRPPRAPRGASAPRPITPCSAGQRAGCLRWSGRRRPGPRPSARPAGWCPARGCTSRRSRAWSGARRSR